MPLTRSTYIDADFILSLLMDKGEFQLGDLVFVGGSAAEGHATPRSDIDVFIIRRIASQSPSGTHMVPFPHGCGQIDLEIWPLAEVEALFDKTRIAVEATTRDSRAFMGLTEDERDFLHRLVEGIPLNEPASFAELRSRVDRTGLTKLSMSRAVMGVTNSQVDLLGWLEAGDWQSATVAAQRLVDFAALALLAGEGCTHPGGKWTTTLLRNHFHERSLPERLIAGSDTLVDRYYTLQCRPRSPAEIKSYAQDCIDFANLSFIYGQTSRTTEMEDILKRIFWQAPAPQCQKMDGSFRPRLNSAVQIRKHENRWLLMRVAEERFEVNATTVSILLLLDGRSTKADVVQSLSPCTDLKPEVLARAVNDVVNFLDISQLLTV